MEISEEIKEELDRQIRQYENMTEFTRPYRQDAQKIIDSLGGDLKISLEHRSETILYYIILLFLKETTKKGVK